MRYSAYGQFDDPPIIDGDESFKGIITKDDGDVIAPGMLSSGTNIRLDRGYITPRKTTRPITNATDCTTLQNGNAVSAIRWNDSLSDNDKILVACETKAFSHTGDEADSLQEIPYPYYRTLGDTGFLIQTGVNVLLFPGDSLLLNFKLDSTAVLGSSVMRLDDYQTYNPPTNEYGTQKRFLHWKEVQAETITQTTSATGEIVTLIKTLTPHSFVDGELIKIEPSTPLSDWRVSEVIDRNEFKIVPAQTDPTGSWGASAPGISSSVAYPWIWSQEDECPGAEFSTWAGNRLIVPAGNDDIFISSPLSTHDFPQYNRLTIGSNDSGKITALEPMGDDSLLVFKTNSLYLVTGIYSMLTADQGGNLAITRISDQMGCENYRAVQIVGQEIMFLNRKGVYALTLNAKGQGGIGLPPQAVRITDIPLSRDIDDQFDEEYYFDKSSLTFYGGRLYLLTRKKEQSGWSYDYHTSIWVYNTLLARWESIDEYRDGGKELFSIRRDKPELIMFHESEGLVELEKHENTFDRYNSPSGDDNLSTEFKTRKYRANTFQQKHWKRISFNWNKLTSMSSDNFTYRFNYENPDKTYLNSPKSSYDSSGNYVTPIDSYITRDRLLDRGDSFQLQVATSSMRYKFKRLVVEASEGSRTTTQIS